MKVFAAAVVLLLATLGGAASTQTNGHVGPPSPSGQWPNIPSAQVQALTAAQKAAIFIIDVIKP